jgi:mannose-6-phosphate isomerase-like protein (cupin superfamily)
MVAAMESDRGFDLHRTFVQLVDGPAAIAVPVGPDFWATIDQRPELHGGRLITVSAMDTTWPHWEIHPAGDELVYALSGSCEFVLEEDRGERSVLLVPQTACIVPRGVWHRAIVHEAGEMLFVTRGAGTQHRPR